MPISVFDMFKIGIGPSSSHTVGPMRAARAFCLELKEKGLLAKTARLQVQLYGSLALTGKGHATDLAVLLGLEGETPQGVDPDTIDARLQAIRDNKKLELLKEKTIDFNEENDVKFLKSEFLPKHSNGMRFFAYDESGETLLEEDYYSIGGGFIVRGDEEGDGSADGDTKLPYDFNSAEELLTLCRDNKLTIPELVMENEKTWRNEDETRNNLLGIWQVMRDCVDRGTREEGILPGVLKVRRRAAKLKRALEANEQSGPLDVMDWINLYALAVNEENAAGGRVVTAPTNGAAGIVPAVLHYYRQFCEDYSEDGVIRFLLTAAAIGMLYKKNAGISGAEMGCQGEVGVACSMAAAGLVSALNGSLEQIENAAEIGMEHNLGLTCDPIAGLVQIPCIERNAMGSVKAINAARMAMRGDGKHHVSLDQVISTMRQTGKDMQSIYKETSLGGLAVNVPEC